MSEKDAAIEKIRKLLRMQRGGSAGEIANALRLAQDIAEKHGVDLGSVDPDECPSSEWQRIGHLDAVTGSRIQWEWKYAGLISEAFFRVNVLVRPADSWAGRRPKRCISIIGTESDREIALYVCRFLVAEFRRAWSTRFSRRVRSRQPFLFGMYLGILSKLAEQLPDPPAAGSPGLIRIEKAVALRKDYMKQKWGEVESTSVKPDGNSDVSKKIGFLVGLRTEIRPAVKGASGPQLLLQ